MAALTPAGIWGLESVHEHSGHDSEIITVFSCTAQKHSKIGNIAPMRASTWEFDNVPDRSTITMRLELLLVHSGS
jgi:hypothetical protein